MAVNIKLKRSAVPGQVPTTAQLELGELALNTRDGKAFFKQDVNGVQSIVELATTSGSNVSTASYALYAENAGSASNAANAISASYSLVATSASYAITASSADNFLVRGTLTAQTIVAQYVTSSTSFITGSTKFGTISSNTHEFTGSVTISGSLAVNDSDVILTNQTSSLNLSRIISGSVIAGVDVDPNNLFLIKSGSTVYFNISSNSNTTLHSDLFIIKNFTTQQPVLTISQSVVQFATQSFNPSGTTSAGSIWFTSSSMYIGLEDSYIY